MEIENLYNRLYNDVFAHLYPDLYLLNQEGDINKFNTFKKRKLMRYIDGGKVIKRTKEYVCSYGFDFRDNESKFKKLLEFCSYKGSAGLNLLDFVNSVLNGNSEIFVKVDNLISYDARKYLFEVITISISDSVIDEMFFNILKKYFHRVKEIKFYNCIVKKECNLNSVSSHMELNRTTIENSRSLNDCTADICMSRCSISKISPTVIKSKKLTISCFSSKYYVDLKMLFFKCNFPNLISFEVRSNHYSEYSFEDNFDYLPYSAPNLEKIIIEGKVRDLKFLTEFKYLIDCSILSIEDDMSLCSTYVTNGKERKKIFERNKSKYEIEKILFPDSEDEFIIADLERERILGLCHFLSTLSYTEEDKKNFAKKDIIKTLVNKKVDLNVRYYFECYYDTLHPKRQSSEIEMRLNYDDLYCFFGKYLCVYDPTTTLSKIDENQILKTKSFMFASNGIPIIFKQKYKPIRTIEDAKKKMVGAKNTKFNLSDYNYKQFVNFLEEYPIKINQAISVSDFIYMIDEQFGYQVNGSDFLNFGPAGKRVNYAFDASKRAYKRIDDIINKIDQYKKLLIDVIRDNYESFIVEEKAYIYYDKFEMNIAETDKDIERFKIIYDALVFDEKAVLESINLKTKGLYSKYRNYIGGFTELKSLLGNPYYDVYIELEDIKQLELHL